MQDIRDTLVGPAVIRVEQDAGSNDFASRRLAPADEIQ
jgi:hypothetical protein